MGTNWPFIVNAVKVKYVNGSVRVVYPINGWPVCDDRLLFSKISIHSFYGKVTVKFLCSFFPTYVEPAFIYLSEPTDF